MEFFVKMLRDTYDNKVSLLFVGIIVIYAVFKVVENKMIYKKIDKMLKELNEDYKNSNIYKDISKMYNKYMDSNLCEINNQTLIEEYISTIYIDKKCIVKYSKNIKNAGSNCILLGVLGTFIGLLIVLSDIGNTGDSHIITAISGMNVAFVTSVFGIITSIVLNYILLNRSSIEHVTLQIMLKLETLIHKKSSQSKNRQFNNTINDIKKSIEKISYSIKAIERFDEITMRLNAFTENFDNSINNFNDAMDNTKPFISNFSENINKMDNQFKSLNENFKKIFSLYEENQKFNEELMKNTTDTNKFIKDSMDSIKQNIDFTTDSQKEVNESLKTLFANIEKNYDELFEKMSFIMDSILEKEDGFNGNINNLNETLKEYSEELNNILASFDKMNESIKSQSDSINGSFVKDVKEVMKEFDRYVSTTNKIIEKKLDAMSNFITSENSKN